MIAALREFLRTRVPSSGPAATIPGGPSFAYVAGWVLAASLLLQAVTGAALAAFYSPSATDAWASVAYIQDRVALGWFVRGLHAHGASALVIVAGLHLVHTAVYGAYKRPREVVWWTGLVLLLLVIAFAITGYVLRWDQAGYWANRVEIGIAAGTPVVGDTIRAVAIGGNEYGNLTLTRFHTLHVIVLPAICVLLISAHVMLARRHGATSRWDRRDVDPVPRWPAQSLRAAIAIAAAVAVLVAYVVYRGGEDLAAPADPSTAYDARPLWFFRWLFELRRLAGSYEQLAALAAPAVAGGLLVALPLLDRSVDRAPRRRLAGLGALAGLLSLIAGLTISSFAVDAKDHAFAERRAEAAELGARTRRIAARFGVPVTGPGDVLEAVPMGRARRLFARTCAGCHAPDSADRKGPIIMAGHMSRSWFRALLRAPGADAFWGRTELARDEAAMQPVELPPAELDDVIELLYAQTGADDVDATKRSRGVALFETHCADCHGIADGVAGASAPGLAGIGSRDWFTSVIGNPKAAIHLGPEWSEMPAFGGEFSIVDRDALAAYLVWLRTATPLDVARLEAW